MAVLTLEFLISQNNVYQGVQKAYTPGFTNSYDIVFIYPISRAFN